MTPYGLHGRPQWKRPLRNSKAPRWMWSSRKPRTRAVGLEPLNGVPLTFSSTSGKLAQPWVAWRLQCAAVPWATRPSAPTASGPPELKLVSRTVEPSSVTFQSPLAPGVAIGTTVLSAEAPGMRPSGP